jgi:hypothetical protein
MDPEGKGPRDGESLGSDDIICVPKYNYTSQELLWSSELHKLIKVLCCLNILIF